MAFKMKGWQAHSNSPLQKKSYNSPLKNEEEEKKSWLKEKWENVKDKASNVWEEVKSKAVNMDSVVGNPGWVESQRAFEKKQNEMRQKYLDALRKSNES